MDKPLVSVIMPSYNHESYIQEAIESVVNQTYQNVELIVVDDGSSDSTYQKIEELKNKHESRFKRFYIESKENEGTTKTLNRLIELSQGEFIYLIASDDAAKIQAIEKEVDFLINNPDYALCVGDSEFIDKDSKVCYWDRGQNLLYNYSAEFLTFASYLQRDGKIDFKTDDFGSYRKLYFENHVPNGYLIRKSIFEKTGLFRVEAPLEDWYLMLQISKYAKMKYLDEILFSYRVHPTNSIKNKEKMIDFYNKTFKFENEVILPNLDFSKTLPEIAEIYQNGILSRKRKILGLFEIETYKKYKKKIKKIKLFNKEIYKYETEVD